MRGWLAYVGYLAALNLRAAFANRRRALWMALAMFSQDFLLFAGWIIFFRAVGTVRGWGLPEIYRLYGLLFASFGLSSVVDGVRDLGWRVVSRDIDALLAQPRHPLPQVLFTRCTPAAFGDIGCGLLFLALFSGLDANGFCLSLVLAVLMAVFFTAAMLVCHSMAFFVAGGEHLGNTLQDCIYYLATVPQQSESWLFKAMLFTVMPAGFVSLLPVRILSEGGWLPWLEMLAGVVVYSLFAAWVFNLGVRRYKRAG